MSSHSSLFLFLINIYNVTAMKKHLLKIFAGATIVALGIGVFSGINQKTTQVNATPHTSNYADYTYSGSYYSSLTGSYTDGLNGTLRTTLSSLIFPKGWYTYGSPGEDHLATQLQYADEDPTNSANMVLLYTRDSVIKQQPINTGVWNREHVWPQNLSNGHWGTTEAGTDILHIRPTYETTNGSRGNLKYGYESNGTTQTYNGIVYGKKDSCFEPIDSVKGDVARIIMYVWTAYYDYYKDSNLLITKVFASYNTLLQWHTLDKPDAMEGLRNDYSQSSKQKNRNPFVDHPEYAWQIFGNEANSNVKQECMAAYPADGSSVQPSKQLNSIAISGEATKKTYTVGDSFNPNGLTVTATYSDGSTGTIPSSNCSWTPNPLTEGTTSVTCTYDGKTAPYQGITVQKKQAVSGSYSIEFKKNDADGTSALAASTIFSDQIKDNTLIQSIKYAYKIFSGTNGLKIGSSSDAGEIEMILSEEASEKIKSIEIESSQYSRDTGTLVLSVDDEIIDGDITPGTTYKKTFNNPITAETLSVSTSTKRAYLSKITIVVEDTIPVDPDPQPSSSSEPISSSSEEPISSSEPSSSGEPSSIPESEESSSSEIESISEGSEEATSTKPEITPSSSEENTPSESSSVPEQSSSNSTPSESRPKKTGGCHGSLLATLSLTSFTALIGLAFIAFKKKF